MEAHDCNWFSTHVPCFNFHLFKSSFHFLHNNIFRPVKITNFKSNCYVIVKKEAIFVYLYIKWNMSEVEIMSSFPILLWRVTFLG